MEKITLDVSELSNLCKTEQAQRFEDAERQIDEIQRTASGDPHCMQWVNQQRKYLMDIQQLIFE